MYSSIALTKKAVCVYYSNKCWKQKIGWKQSYATKSAINIGIRTRINLMMVHLQYWVLWSLVQITHSLVKLCSRFLHNTRYFFCMWCFLGLLDTEKSPFLGKVRHQSVLRMTRQGDRWVIYNRQMTHKPATTATDRLKTGRNVELSNMGSFLVKSQGDLLSFLF